MIHSFVVLIAFLVNALSVELTHFGYEAPNSPNYDSNSAQGIGAFPFDSTAGSMQNINATGVIAAALSPDVAAQYNLQPGQQFTVNTASGSFDLVYADKTADYLTGRIDLYDPSGTFQGSGITVTSINGGAIIEGSGGATLGAPAQTLSVQVVDMLLGKFKNVGQSWVSTLQNASTFLFWTLAVISLVFTGIYMAIKRAELGEIMAEIVRYIMFTGFFFWLLQNGPTFAQNIIDSLRQLGGQAAGGGQSLYPGDLISVGIQVVNNAMTHLNFLAPAASGIPVLFAVVILAVCCLITANLILLLVAAWVVLYAGLIFLGFGGCRWTSDWALGYWKTVLGIGVSLMTMELIIGIGAGFLKDIVQQTGNNGDIGQLMAVFVAVIILAIIAHQLPKMVAGMVQGGGYSGHVGGLGIMSMIGAGIAGAGMANRMGAGSVVAAVGGSAAKLVERMSVLDSSIGNGGRVNQPAQLVPDRVMPVDPPIAEDIPPHPISPDEQKGFEPPNDWNAPE